MSLIAPPKPGGGGLFYAATASGSIAQGDLVGYVSSGVVAKAANYGPKRSGTDTLHSDATVLGVAYSATYDVLFVVYQRTSNGDNYYALIDKSSYTAVLGPTALPAGTGGSFLHGSIVFDPALDAGVILINSPGANLIRYWHFRITSATTVTMSSYSDTSASGIASVHGCLIASGEALVGCAVTAAYLLGYYIAFNASGITTFTTASNSSSGSTGSRLFNRLSIAPEPGANRAMVVAYCYSGGTTEPLAIMLSKNGTSAPTWNTLSSALGGGSDYPTGVLYDPDNSSWIVCTENGSTVPGFQAITNSGTTITVGGSITTASTINSQQGGMLYHDTTSGKNLFLGYHPSEGLCLASLQGRSTAGATTILEEKTHLQLFGLDYNSGNAWFSYPYPTGNWYGFNPQCLTKIDAWGGRLFLGCRTDSSNVVSGFGPVFVSIHPDTYAVDGYADVVLGIAQNAATDGNSVTVKSFYETSDISGFSAGDGLYNDINGELSTVGVGSPLAVATASTKGFIAPYNLDTFFTEYLAA